MSGIFFVFIKSSKIPGMIPIRYSSLNHAVKVILFEEKIKGLWRGVGLHSVNVLLRLAVIQTVFQHLDINK